MAITLSRLPAPVVGYVSGALALGTILICYILAVYLGHVPAWLPFISDCGVYPPEVYPFRIGLVLAPAVFIVQALIVYSTDRVFSSKICLVLGIISAMSLTVVAVVSEVENLKVHLGNNVYNTCTHSQCYLCMHVLIIFILCYCL